MIPYVGLALTTLYLSYKQTIVPIPDRQTNKQTNKQTDRQTDRQTSIPHLYVLEFYCSYI